MLFCCWKLTGNTLHVMFVRVLNVQLVITYRDPLDTNSNVNALLKKFEPYDMACACVYLRACARWSDRVTSAH